MSSDSLSQILGKKIPVDDSKKATILYLIDKRQSSYENAKQIHSEIRPKILNIQTISFEERVKLWEKVAEQNFQFDEWIKTCKKLDKIFKTKNHPHLLISQNIQPSDIEFVKINQ